MFKAVPAAICGLVLFCLAPQFAIAVQLLSASASVEVSVAQMQPIAAGAAFDYVIHVNNEGPDDAASVTLTFPLPSGVAFQSDSVPAGWSCTTPAPGSGGTITCTAATLAPGTATFTITASTPPTASGTFSTTASITSATPDPDANDNSFDVDVLVAPSTDFSVAVAGTPNPVNAGTDLTWTVVVANNGPSTASAASVTLPLPAPATFLSLAAPAGWTCSTPAPGTNGTISCSLSATMNPATQATFTIVSNVPGSVAGGTTLSATATVSAPADAFPANDSATASVTTAAVADIAVTKTRTASLVIAGGPLHYTITVTNNGPSDTAGVTMTDVLPAPLRFTSISAPAGWSCTTPPAGANGTIVCSTTPMAAAATATFALDVVVDPATSAGTVINNTATVTTPTSDPNSANNSSTSSAGVSTPPNVTATKSIAGGATHPEGSVITYTIVLANSGSIAQTDNPGNELTDVLPASLTLVSAIASSGAAVANTGTNTVTWNGAIAGGGSVTITIQALVNNGTSGTTIANQATVSYDSDGNGTNDASRVSDDPSTAAQSDPTAFVVVGIVPALSRMSMLLLAVALTALALAMMKP
ncbi:MAG: DUF11 domain-containing protein [Acidobacteria bacterium]|nr:DUF11 domain-containing protein [Acidobacteriota bacterium]MBV9187763.1 DUF11 domain-containing protein [Acidobacteriota bacterium]